MTDSVSGSWQPTVVPGGRLEDVALSEWVGQALGAASSCWANLGGAGEFDSVRCAGIYAGLMGHLNEVIDAVNAGAGAAAAPVAGDDDQVMVESSRPVNERATMHTVDVEEMPE